MLEPPDLSRPFVGDQDRAEALVGLLRACEDLRRWIVLADVDHLPEEAVDDLSVRVQPEESSEMMLARWRSLFDDELQAVFDSRNRFVHGLRLTDKELRSAQWLARELLRLVDPSEAA